MQTSDGTKNVVEEVTMNTLIEKITDFLKEEEGLTTVEYAVAGSLVAAGVVAAFTTLGTNVDASIDTLADCVNGAAGLCAP